MDYGRVFEIYYGYNTAAEYEKKWYKNADEIAAFLGSINPFWSEEEWRKMMHEHLMLVNSKAVDILSGNYAAGIAVYDEIERQTLRMADMISKGIFNQFPNEFAE